jgi:PPOX class probable F420-dependent enzyme
VDTAAALEFVARNHHTVIAVRKPDGTPALSPVDATVDADGHVVISSRETAFKVRNLRRDPHAWLCVLSDGFYGDWVQLAADVEIVGMPEALEPLVDYYRSISGEHPDWDDYRAAMARDQRCLIKLTLTDVGPKQMG